MKILVTGGVGFMGTNLIKKLLSEGHKVHSLDNYEVGLKENEQSGCFYYNNDIVNINFLDKDFDLIFHLAALSRIQPSFNNPNETFRVNTIGTQKVCEFARLTGAKVVYAGSSSRWHNPYQSPYAACKHMGEEACKMYKKTYGMSIEIVRFYNVYGQGEIVDGDWAAVIGKWRRQVRDGESITIVGDGEQRRDFTHIDDIVVGCYLALIKGKQNEYMLCTNKSYSIVQIAKMFKTKFKFIKSRPGERFGSTILNNNAKKILGFKAKKNIRDYIKNFISKN